MALKELTNVLKGLPDSVRIKKGKKLRDDEVDALQTELGLVFPEDYRAFLHEFGSLSVRTKDPRNSSEEVFVMGAGGKCKRLFVGEVDLPSAAKVLREEQAKWLQGGDPPKAVPFLIESDSWSEGWAFDTEGKARYLYRGRFEDFAEQSFVDVVVDALEPIRKAVAEDLALGSLRDRAREALLACIPSKPVSRKKTRIVVERADGRNVSLSFDTEPRIFKQSLQREIPVRSLFVQWYEGEMPLDELARRNSALLCSRGSVVEGRTRFRGRVLLSPSLSDQHLAQIVANDTGLGLKDTAVLPQVELETCLETLEHLAASDMAIVRYDDLTVRDGVLDFEVEGGVWWPTRLRTVDGRVTVSAEAWPANDAQEAQVSANYANHDPRRPNTPDSERFARATAIGHGVVLDHVVLPHVARAPELFGLALADLVALRSQMNYVKTPMTRPGQLHEKDLW